MAIREILVPQMGEGLQEVCILGFQKKVGEMVKRDEMLYSMETDKAVMEVESPFEGVLTEWLAEEGAILPIGAPVARIEVTESVTAEAAVHAASNGATLTPNAAVPQSGITIPPRSRAYAREKNVSDAELFTVPAPSGKLMPADIDNYLAAKIAAPTAAAQADAASPAFSERPMSSLQRVFNYRLKRSAQIVIPAVIKRPMEWGTIRNYAEKFRAANPDIQPSTFQTFAYSVVQAAKEHPKFRSAILGEDIIREYAHLNVGIAVGLPDGQLTIAVVQNADALDYPEFIRTAQSQIQKAREGEDQAGETVQLLLTYMGPYDVHDAIPVLVAPAVAVLFIGSNYERNGETLVNLALTFDHRLIQGIEGAEFMKTVVAKAEQIEQVAAWPALSPE